jgi:hypothetical protein
MRLKLALLAMFTAVVSFACAGTSQMARQEPMEQRATSGSSYKPITVQQTELVLRGQCVAKLTFDEKSGGLIKVATDPPCRVTEDQLLVNGLPVLDLSGSLTFGSGTKYCRRLANGTISCVCMDKAC